MFKNLGVKLKTCAIILFVIENIAVAYVAYSLFDIQQYIPSERNYMFSAIVAILTIWILGCISSFVVYGIGYLVDCVDIIDNKTRHTANQLDKIDRKIGVVFDKLSSNHMCDRNAQSVEDCEKNTSVCDEDTNSVTSSSEKVEKHSWRCAWCGRMRLHTPCEHCGKE